MDAAWTTKLVRSEKAARAEQAGTGRGRLGRLAAELPESLLILSVILRRRGGNFCRGLLLNEWGLRSSTNALGRTTIAGICTSGSAPAAATPCGGAFRTMQRAVNIRGHIHRKYRPDSIAAKEGNVANTTKIEDKAERKKVKRAARKKAAPKAKRTTPRGSNKKKVKKLARGQSKR